MIDEYHDYITRVSQPHMAISLEAAQFLHLWCQVYKPQRIVDLGSGFSSYVFRHYQQKSKNRVTVVSVDDNQEWLKRTKNFLQQHYLSTEHLILYDKFLAKPKQFDLWFYDLGSISTRIKEMPKILQWSRDAFLIMDDAHKKRMRKSINMLNMRRIHALTRTTDSIGRFAALVYPE
ncbi:hypothetical protein GF342_03515 [Candidatus Woesearchaeota archaeon]|nr:hypothetical protein [Candidatus Woesearchaeota archaeon]